MLIALKWSSKCAKSSFRVCVLTYTDTSLILWTVSLKVPVPNCLENEFSLNWQIWSLFLPKQCLCYLLFYKWWKPRFLISKRVFRWFLLNYIDFVHKISHIKPSKYDSSFFTKISISLKKVWGWGCGSEQALKSSYKCCYPWVATQVLCCEWLHSYSGAIIALQQMSLQRCNQIQYFWL